MTALRITFIGMSVLIFLFTFAAFATDGFDLLTPFVAPIFAMSWQGQFNVDFSCYLVLSGIWMAWRGGFTRASIAQGILAPPLGMFFFAPYLLVLAVRSNGDARQLLLGVHA